MALRERRTETPTPTDRGPASARGFKVDRRRQLPQSVSDVPVPESGMYFCLGAGLGLLRLLTRARRGRRLYQRGEQPRQN
jgi:hypothetical protein